MKNNKILYLLFLVLIIILILLFFTVKNFITISNNSNTELSEYTPQEEISNSQLRQTKIALYFFDESSNLKIEYRLIDSNILINNPYKSIIELLLNGPENNSLISPFPKNTKILDAYIENNCVTLDFSNEILDFVDENQKLNIKTSISNTLTNLYEVNTFKIYVNNMPSEVFN